MVNNQLGDIQKTEIKSIFNLIEDDLNLLVENIEYQLNEFGNLPKDPDGSINLNLDFQNNPKELRDLLKEISNTTSKLTKLVKRHDLKVDESLSLATSKFDLKPTKIEPNGIQYFESIEVSSYLTELEIEVISKSEYHNEHVKAKSQSIVLKIYHAWCCSCPNLSTQKVKDSTNDNFIKLVNIVTGWDLDSARKNVSNALKKKKESCS